MLANHNHNLVVVDMILKYHKSLLSKKNSSTIVYKEIDIMITIHQMQMIPLPVHFLEIFDDAGATLLYVPVTQGQV